ncbi:hypothetical protein A0J61_08091 [Choanephora cucurbitarum]|uniref:PAS domain-containing protein n=1 Tax=Choanephora cucurbitarum TaxID=101091 RepID=A0A1C7N5C0_9FUNG|nr:hypothetical protein A0J61_08091 [Choanephora cucurbitarum]
MHHSFYDCPLRNSSLLVVHKEHRTILTATDEVFNMLGYGPSDLFGKSIKRLNPQREIKWKLKHATEGLMPFEICVHHDPFETNATHLEYWLIQPITVLTATNTSSFSILRLSSYGTIEQAQLAFDFPQSTRSLIGCPIMSFIHEADVRLFCTNLSQMHNRPFASFHVRWIHDPSKHSYIHFNITVIHVPDKKRQQDGQIWPICIIRPEKRSSLPYCSQFNLLSYLASDLTLCASLFKQWFRQASQTTVFVESIVKALHHALVQGKLYLLEFLVHAVVSISSTIHEWLLDSHHDHEVYVDSLSSHGVYNLHRHRRRTKKKEQRGSKRDSCFIVNVSTETCLWPVPIFRHTHSHPPYIRK